MPILIKAGDAMMSFPIRCDNSSTMFFKIVSIFCSSDRIFESNGVFASQSPSIYLTTN